MVDSVMPRGGNSLWLGNSEPQDGCPQIHTSAFLAAFFFFSAVKTRHSNCRNVLPSHGKILHVSNFSQSRGPENHTRRKKDESKE